MTYLEFTSLVPQQVLTELKTAEQGLTKEEAEKRLKELGKNRTKQKYVSRWQILVRQLKSPFQYLLMGAFGLSFVLGERADGLMILLFVGLNTFLGFFQEYRSEQTVKLLNKHLASRSKVSRAGAEVVVETEDLVPGDIVLLEPGDIVPADLRLIWASNLLVDESALTGESAATAKTSEAIQSRQLELFEAGNICFSGTNIVAGEAKGVVFATGSKTEYAEIAKLSSETRKGGSSEKEIGKFSRFVLILVATTLALVLGVNMLFQQSASALELIVFAIALAVSVIPEALPVVTTFSLSIGAARLAKRKVVVKRLSAIEDLGAIEVLCSDKTGTLTENNLTVDETLNRSKKEVLVYAALGTIGKKIVRNRGNKAFEEAIFAALNEEQRKSLSQYKIMKEIPFDPQRKRSSCAVMGNKQIQLVVQGAAEEIWPLVTGLTKREQEEMMKWVEDKGRQGIRVLAVATRKIEKEEVNNLEAAEKLMELVGLVSFADPIKKSTREAVNLARDLGVQVKILTGDGKEVAGAVAYQTGLVNDPTEVITGAEFERLSGAAQREAVLKYQVFARVTPDQKYNIIGILQERFEVGFLGEGINDAPALKNSNVGIVVKDASDVAREAADIILLDKSLEVIIEGIRQGRTVFANTNKYITATLSANFGNFFAVAIVSLLINYLPMLPLQILLVNLLSDFPMILIATDTVDSESIAQPHRFDMRNFALISLLLGIVSTVFDFIFFMVFRDGGAEVLQTGWFMGSILTELVFIYSIRTKKPFWQAVRPPAAITGLVLLAVAITTAIPFTRFGQDVFSFVAPTGQSMWLIMVIVGGYLVTTEGVKLLYYRFLNPELGGLLGSQRGGRRRPSVSS